MVDLDRIHQRLELLAGYLRELRRLRDLSVAEYLRHEVYAGRYLVQVAAQTCIDLANHIIASEGWRAPRDFGDSFTILAEHGVVDDALAVRLRGLAGLRSTTLACTNCYLPDCQTWTRSPPHWPGS